MGTQRRGEKSSGVAVGWERIRKIVNPDDREMMAAIAGLVLALILIGAVSVGVDAWLATPVAIRSPAPCCWRHPAAPQTRMTECSYRRKRQNLLILCWGVHVRAARTVVSRMRSKPGPPPQVLS
jgi:hypothetical protein